MEKKEIEYNGTLFTCFEDGSVEWEYLRKGGYTKRSRTFGSKIKKEYGNKYNFGYMRVHVNKKHIFVHRLIALAFVPNPNNFPFVDHINGDRSDNRPCNLRWADYFINAYNRLDGHRSKEIYGVRRCEDKKAYNKSYKQVNREKILAYDREWYHKHKAMRLNAIKPSGTRTTMYPKSKELYDILKPLSYRDRYAKWCELCGSVNQITNC